MRAAARSAEVAIWPRTPLGPRLRVLPRSTPARRCKPSAARCFCSFISRLTCCVPWPVDLAVVACSGDGARPPEGRYSSFDIVVLLRSGNHCTSVTRGDAREPLYQRAEAPTTAGAATHMPGVRTSDQSASGHAFAFPRSQTLLTPQALLGRCGTWLTRTSGQSLHDFAELRPPRGRKNEADIRAQRRRGTGEG